LKRSHFNNLWKKRRLFRQTPEISIAFATKKSVIVQIFGDFGPESTGTGWKKWFKPFARLEKFPQPQGKTGGTGWAFP